MARRWRLHQAAEVAAFSWRIAEESKVATEHHGVVWLPPADYLNLAAMTANFVGVFLLPGIELIGIRGVQISFGLAALLFLGHAFSLAGHYELYGRGRKRSFRWWPRQEKVAMLCVAVGLAAYLYLALQWK